MKPPANGFPFTETRTGAESPYCVLEVDLSPLLFAMILRVQGVGKVFVSEPTVKRREHAVEICHPVTDPGKEDVGEGCRSLTDGAGVSVVFDCAGVRVRFRGWNGRSEIWRSIL